nr:MAG TPA: hypothetical protein [Caudoviricetes sp.]
MAIREIGLCIMIYYDVFFKISLICFDFLLFSLVFFIML